MSHQPTLQSRPRRAFSIPHNPEFSSIWGTSESSDVSLPYATFSASKKRSSAFFKQDDIETRAFFAHGFGEMSTESSRPVEEQRAVARPRKAVNQPARQRPIHTMFQAQSPIARPIQQVTHGSGLQTPSKHYVDTHMLQTMMQMSTPLIARAEPACPVEEPVALLPPLWEREVAQKCNRFNLGIKCRYVKASES